MLKLLKEEAYLALSSRGSRASYLHQLSSPEGPHSCITSWQLQQWEYLFKEAITQPDRKQKS